MSIKHILALTGVLCCSAAQADSSRGCPCRAADGSMRPAGSEACFTIGGERVAMRCQMSLNNPYWKRVEDRSACTPS